MDRVAAITGGAGGIGTATAEALEASGYTVAILDREAEFSVDLASEDETRACARSLLERFGRVDMIVHAAASFDRVPLATIDRETMRQVHAVNVESVLWLAQELTPKMAEAKFGRIVMLVSDTVLEPPRPEFLPYVTSKAALMAAVRVLAHTLGGEGITVNSVSPGFVRVARTEASAPEEVFEHERLRQAVPRTVMPADVAGMIAYLASDDSAMVSGQTLRVNGGSLMY
jgi:pyridoxal 4-dehydrogenase